MVEPAPKLDRRTATDISRQVQTLLSNYAPDWQEFTIDPVTGDRIPQGISAALIGIFARFAEIIIQRLNRVPDKNLLAFLNLLGASRQPPQPARVPLTFSLAAGSTQAIVPAGTQVAAPPAVGEQEPIIYETQADLLVTATQIAAVFTRDLAFDRYADHNALIQNNLVQNNLIPDTVTRTIFQTDRAVEHHFYLAHNAYFSLPRLKAIRLEITLAETIPNPPDERSLVWEYYNGTDYVALTPSQDSTQRLTASGTIAFGDTELTRDSNPLPELHPIAVNQQAQRWLRCRLITPITATSDAKRGMVRESQLPTITAIQTQIAIRRTNLLPDAAFTNSTPVDLNKSIFPFGERPAVGDTFYLACQEGFARVGTEITLTFTLLNSRRLSTSENQLKWSFWDGTIWRNLTVRTSINAELTTESVTFTLPSQPASQLVNGVESSWIRVQVNSRDYGQEATFLPRKIRDQQGRIVDELDQRRQIIDFTPATFAPPILSAISITYAFSTANQPPLALHTYNYLDYRAIAPTSSFKPFTGLTSERRPTLYLGLQMPEDLQLNNRVLSLFLQPTLTNYGEREVPVDPSQSYVTGEPRTTAVHRLIVTNPTTEAVTYQLTVFGNAWDVMLPFPNLIIEAGQTREVNLSVEIPDDATANESDRALLRLTHTEREFTVTLETAVADASTIKQPQLLWQYWDGQGWNKLAVDDRTHQFTRSGLVEFLFPDQWQPKHEFGQPNLHWLRMVWTGGQYVVPATLQRLVTNTTIASQSITLQNEILGSSDGTEHQKFTTRRSPVLSGQLLDVRESELSGTTESPDQETTVWIPWQEVSDFYGSGPRDRHYTLDHITGEIQFGNGINGRIPPLGSGNLRLSHYQTGGGTAGNRPAGAIIQLKTTIPYVNQVINLESATGGADAEAIAALLERAPRLVRHGDRAVTLEDFEDLALLASPEVARARCVPLINLKADPLAIVDSSPDHPPTLGEISVIIVPRSTEKRPVPSLELLDRVQSYLESHSSPVANLSVVGPLYIEVSVTVEIVPTTLEASGKVEQAVQQTLDRFLHPLTGGLDGTGWNFGRKPHRSDFFALLEAIPSVDHIRHLTLTPSESPPSPLQAILNTTRFLVHSGPHTIRITPPS